MSDKPKPSNKWTFLLFQLNAALDRGEHLDIAETARHIQDGTVFDWLKEALPFIAPDLSEPGETYPRDGMVGFLQRIDNVGASEFGVANNGIAMLIAYGLEAIQTED